MTKRRDADSLRDPVEELAEEFFGRRRGGEEISIEEFVREHPTHADRIRELFPALEMMEQGLDADSGPFRPLGESTAAPPRRLGDYRIVREIGRGGMGVVYLAEQQAPIRRRVALKVIKLGMDSKAVLAQQILRFLAGSGFPPGRVRRSLSEIAMKTKVTAVLSLCCLALCACSGGELVGIHVTLQKNGSGTFTARGLASPDAGRGEKLTQGVTWAERASVVASQGTFKRLGDVRYGNNGVRFAAGLGDEPPSLRVYVPCGPNAEWVKALIPDRATRRAMAKVYDPTGKTREVGDVIRLEVELPGEVVASSVHPTGRGIEAGRERKRAYLLLPARSVTEADEELVWDVTWR